MSRIVRRYLGNWKICLALFFVPALVFPLLVQPRAEAIVQHGRGAPRILDEYVMTWTPQQAEALYSDIGPEGRAAIQHFYLTLDFWIPVLSLALFYMSLLSIAFPAGSRLAAINLLPILMWLFDEAENVNHFIMARLYPTFPSWSLTIGPWFTFCKWLLIFAIPIIGIVGLVARPRRKAI